MFNKSPVPTPGNHTVSHLAEQAALNAESAIASTQKLANEALDALHTGVQDLRDAAPTALSRAAAQVEELTRRGVDRARDAGTQVRDQVSRGGEKTASLIRDEPMKAVLIAVATGALVASVVGWLSRSRTER